MIGKKSAMNSRSQRLKSQIFFKTIFWRNIWLTKL